MVAYLYTARGNIIIIIVAVDRIGISTWPCMGSTIGQIGRSRAVRGKGRCLGPDHDHDDDNDRKAYAHRMCVVDCLRCVRAANGAKCRG